MTKDTGQTIGQLMKCNKCEFVGEPDRFVVDNSRKSGRRNFCKECDRARAIARYEAKREEILAARKAKYDPDAVREANKKYYNNNKDKFRTYAKAAWEAVDKEAERERAATWRAENPDKVRAIWNRKDRKNRSTAKGRLESNVSRDVCRCLGPYKGGQSTFALLGYTVDELRSHLEKQFLPGMTWDNYGKGGWHVDHIIPKAAFNYETPDDLDFKRCWALSNLQPLWAFDNLSKHDKLDGPFQPSLAIAVPNENGATT